MGLITLPSAAVLKHLDLAQLLQLLLQRTQRLVAQVKLCPAHIVIANRIIPAKKTHTCRLSGVLEELGCSAPCCSGYGAMQGSQQ